MEFTFNAKRLSLFCGHYGSGKTNLAVNYALSLKKLRQNVAIADLDIVNPYFRTKDCEELIKKAGIRLIASEYAGSNVDVPAMPAGAYAITDDESLNCIIDVGGDERGALALGRYADKIKEQNDYEMFFVVNMYRPLTMNVQDTLNVKNEIESACKIKFTHIINNSNLGVETTIEDILKSVPYAKQLEDACGISVKFTGVLDRLFDSVKPIISNSIPVSLYVKQSWLK